MHVLQDDDDAASAHLDPRDRLRAGATARRRSTEVERAVIATGVTDVNAHSDAEADVIAAIRAGTV